MLKRAIDDDDEEEKDDDQRGARLALRWKSRTA